MVGSMDSLDFCTEMPITEKNAVPLDCWQNISLSNIWIPSNSLPSRSKPANRRITQGIYHTLEKKDSSKYAKSFSVYSYSRTESEEVELFVSDSDEDIFGSDSTSFEQIKTSNIVVSKLPEVTDLQRNAHRDNLGICIETNILNKNSERDDRNLHSKENLIVNEKTSLCVDEMCKVENARKVINSEENLMNNRRYLEKDGRVCVKSLSKSDNTGSQNNFLTFKESHEVETNDFMDGVMQTSRKANKDSAISLKEILDDTSEISIKDFAFDLKKKDDSTLLCAYDKKEKKLKKNKKDKGKKKLSKCITLDKFLEGTVDVSQDYYCDKYFQNILNEKYKKENLSNVPIERSEEFPDLAARKYMFMHSEKKIKAKDVKISYDNFRCILNKSEEISKHENVGVEEITDTEYGYNINKSMTDNEYGKVIIENIPPDITKDDILLILCGYGEIKKISLVSAGNFLTAYVEIDLICDIDWIIECLNGSDAFGVSTEKLLCYKQ